MAASSAPSPDWTASTGRQSSSFRYAERNGICSRRTSDGARLNNQQHAMMNVNLTGIRACVFDAYGTLFDVNSAAQRTQDALRDKWQQFAEVWRAKQLQYTWLRSLTGP